MAKTISPRNNRDGVYPALGGADASQVKIRAREFTEPPPGMAEKWLKNTIAAIAKMVRHYKKTIRTHRDFEEKVLKPLQQVTEAFIDPAFVSRSGVHKRDMLARQKEKLKKAPRRAFCAMRKLFQTSDGQLAKAYYDILLERVGAYEKYLVKYLLPLVGTKEVGMGLVTLGAMWVTGEASVVDFLGEPLGAGGYHIGEIIQGKPILITTARKKGIFKKALRNRLIQEGHLVIGSGYGTDCIIRANENINELVRGYTRPEFVPFTPGGASHIDFFVERFFWAGGRPGPRLGLSIVISQKTS